MKEFEILNALYSRVRNGPVKLTKPESIAIAKFNALENTVRATIWPKLEAGIKLTPREYQLLDNFDYLSSIVTPVED